VKVAALLLGRDLSLRLGERELGEPAAGQALVRVEWAGVCGSDLHVLRTGDWVSYWPATLGHEVAGVVEACPGGELAPGTRVVVDSRVGCGTCEGCSRSPQLCERLAWVGEAFPGGFASQLLISASALVACPPDLEPAIAVLAEPLAVAMHAAGHAAADPGRALVIGYGPVGALVHLELTRRFPRCEVAVREPDPARRGLAEALGARIVPAGEETARWPLVVDAAGYPGSLPDAISQASKGGLVVLVALGHATVTLDPAALVEQGLTVAGSNGFAGELAAAVAALHAGPDRYRPVVTEALLLDEAPRRLPELLTVPSTGKVVIRPWAG